MKQFLRENKDMTAKLEAELRQALGLKILVPEPPSASQEQKQAAAAHAKGPVGKR